MRLCAVSPLPLLGEGLGMGSGKGLRCSGGHPSYFRRRILPPRQQIAEIARGRGQPRGRIRYGLIQCDRAGHQTERGGDVTACQRIRVM